MTHLPYRKDSTVITFPWGETFSVRLQYWRNPDDEIVEVWGNLFQRDITTGGATLREFDNEIAEGLKDDCRALSLTLQDGTPIESICTRVRRGDKNEALSLRGAVADAICAEQYQPEPPV